MYTKMIFLLLIFSLSVIQLNCQQICNKCSCTGETSKSIDCSKRNINFKFNDTTLWTTADNKTIDVVSLNFQFNNLTHIFPFPNLNVVTLDLSHNRISLIESLAFKNLQKMETLDLSENQLKTEALTSDVFQGKYSEYEYEPLRSLKILRLSGNLLHSLHNRLFEHTGHVEALYLDSNPFSVIDTSTLVALNDVPYLKILDLSKTNIKTLPPHMLHTSRFLQCLNLSSNQITTLPETLVDAHVLELLHMSNNPIETLGLANSFPHIKTLKQLYLSDMLHLKRIEKGAFSALSNLSELYITRNDNLEYIDEDAFSTQKDNGSDTVKVWIPLKKLDLQRNNLTTLKENLLEDWNSLEMINIQFNPWSCDCNNQWLISKFIPLLENKTSEFTSHLQCHSPEELKGFNMTEMAHRNKELRCLYSNGNLWPKNDGAVLLGILIGVLTTVPIMFIVLYSCQRKNYFGLCGANGAGEYTRTFYKRADSVEDF